MLMTVCSTHLISDEYVFLILHPVEYNFKDDQGEITVIFESNNVCIFFDGHHFHA